MKLIGPEDRKCVSTPRARNDRGRLVSGALGFAWVAGEKKNKVWEHRKCSTIHTRVVRRDGLFCVVVYCYRCEAWYFMPEVVVALVREASDPSILFLFFWGEVGECGRVGWGGWREERVGAIRQRMGYGT